MDKSKTLEAIQSARKSHKAQMLKIEQALDGEDIDNPTAVSKIECNFGLWLYGKDNHVKEILGSQFFSAIELYHSRWHGEYLRIYNILFKKKKKGFFSKMIASPKIDSMELDRVKLYHSELKATTNELLKILASSERRLEAMSESKFY